MWYWFIAAGVAIWTFIDARARRSGGIIVALGTLLFLPLVLPVYLATRYLKAGERREGGRSWNILKNFALAWTGLMAIAAVFGFISASPQIAGDTTGAAAVGAMLGIGVIGAFWFFPMVGAVVLGLLLKQSVVEQGPTGPRAAVRAPQQVV